MWWASVQRVHKKSGLVCMCLWGVGLYTGGVHGGGDVRVLAQGTR